MESILIALLFLVLLSLSAFFSSVEIAFFSLSDARIRSMKQKGLKGTHLVEKLKKRPHRLMATILVGNNLVNIFIASLASALAVSAFGSMGVGIATGAITIAILLLGELVPKAYATSHAETIARYAARTVRIIEIVLLPLVTMLETLALWLTKLSSGKKAASFSIEEDIKSLTQIGYEKGSLDEYENMFVQRLFRFDDIPVSKIMMPIADVFMIKHNQTIQEVESLAVESGYSRFPIYKTKKTNIVGTVHIKDIVTANNKNQGEKPISHIMKPPVTVAGQEIVNDVFLKLRKKRKLYAIVTKGKTPIGIVTLEDIIEELIGEIHDEFDTHKK